MTNSKVRTYLSRTQVAARIGLKNVRSLSGVKLPPPDVLVGDHAGWKPETIDAWQVTRPGHGRWSTYVP